VETRQKARDTYYIFRESSRNVSEHFCYFFVKLYLDIF